MMIEAMLKTATETLILMVGSEIVVKWFVVTTIITTAYAMKANHLDMKRLIRYAILFMLVFIGIIGPAVNYAVVVLERPLNTPSLWVWPTFIFVFFTCLLLGFLLAYLGKKALDLFFEDFHLSIAKFFYELGDTEMQRSKIYSRSGATSMSDLYDIASAKQVQAAIDLKTENV